MSFLSNNNPANPTIDIRHRLDHSQFEKALEILREEQTANSPSNKQRICYRLLTIAVGWGFAFIFAYTTCLMLFPDWLKEVEIHSSVYRFLVGIPSGLMLIVFTPLLFLVNLFLLRNVWRQSRLIRKLHLRELYKMSWRVQRKKLIWMGLVLIFLAAVGLLFIFAALLVEDTLTVIIGLATGSGCLGVCVIMILKNKMDVMMNVESLKQSLDKYRSDSKSKKEDFIDVPLEMMAQLSHIEMSQIARQRADAIDGIRVEGDQSYQVRRSKIFQEAVAMIRPEERLMLEGQIEELFGDPRHVGAIPSGDQATSVVKIPETPYALTYAVDEALHQIDLLALQLPTAAVPDIKE